MRTPYIERLGTGINHIRQEVENAGLPTPQFTYNNFFSITFKRAIGALITSNSLLSKDDALNDAVKTRLIELVKAVGSVPGMKKKDLAERFKVAPVTIERDLKKIQSLVEFQGPQKTGGYYLTTYMKEQLKKEGSDS